MKRQKFKRVKTSDGVVLKSGLEEAVYNYLQKVKVLFTYEGMKIVYFQPAIKKTYTPDFPIQNSQLVIETKGAFNSADRKKMKTIKAQNPNLDIRFIFSNSKTKIGKKSKTTYAKWCELKGFKYHCVYTTGKLLPDDWVIEVLNQQKKL